MDWWQDLWLNEGFATWIQYFVVEKLYPDWNIFEQFVNDDFGRAMSLDQLESSHPIEVPIRAAAEVNEIFDAISYSKGCAVIRMLVEYLTVETFRKGLLIYLERHKYANASTKDLWNALSEASGKDISSMMTSWTRQTGYPVLVVTQADKRKLKITQNRYLSNGIDFNDETIWHIPIAYVTNHGRSEAILMTQKSIEIEVDDFEWIKFNPQQTGFYRVSYPAEYYASVTHAVKNKVKVHTFVNILVIVAN
jgi:aminopeptidase N